MIFWALIKKAQLAFRQRFDLLLRDDVGEACDRGSARRDDVVQEGNHQLLRALDLLQKRE